jgi:hypothetical protein
MRAKAMVGRVVAGRQFGRDRVVSGHGVATANRSFMTHSVTSAPSFAALRKDHSITSSAMESGVFAMVGPGFASAQILAIAVVGP